MFDCSKSVFPILCLVGFCVCIETFYFGGSVDVAREWPLAAFVSRDIAIEKDNEVVLLKDSENFIACRDCTGANIAFSLRSSPFDDLFRSALKNIGAKEYIMIEKQKEEVEMFEIPPTPFASLYDSIPLSDDILNIPIQLQLEPGFYKFTLTAFHCNPKQGKEKIQCSYVSGYPTQTVIINTIGNKSQTFISNIENKNQEQEAHEQLKQEAYEQMSLLYLPHRLHQEVFTYDNKFLDDNLRRYIEGDINSLSKVIKPITESGIYLLQVFTPEFCQMLIEEVDNYESFLVSQNIDPNEHRPNFLNKFGVLLSEIGFSSFLDDFLEQVSLKLTSKLFVDWGGSELDSHHGFIVEYQQGAKDEDLEYHIDQAEVTLNVCLGKIFEGGTLFFQGIRNHFTTQVTHQESFEFQHVPGSALLHIGQHWHGAYKIQSGERYNMILWMRSSKYHQSFAEQFHSGIPTSSLSTSDSMLPQFRTYDIV